MYLTCRLSSYSDDGSGKAITILLEHYPVIFCKVFHVLEPSQSTPSAPGVWGGNGSSRGQCQVSTSQLEAAFKLLCNVDVPPVAGFRESFSNGSTLCSMWASRDLFRKTVRALSLPRLREILTVLNRPLGAPTFPLDCTTHQRFRAQLLLKMSP